jgi:23S rRNA (adenine2030-N6)-methyltransferase
MNYRHIYHAGNFADVFKHCVLIALLQALQRKEKGFCYLDTHAGSGRYDLRAAEAQKTGEFSAGIERILRQKIAGAVPAEISAYLAAIKSINSNPHLEQNKNPAEIFPSIYPGSPLIARHFLRPQDRMILAELHPHDAALLKKEFRNDKQTAAHQQDGYLALKAFVPPAEKRGLALIDPPYEQENESERIYAALQLALKHWATGIYAVWYPIKEQRLAHALQQQLTSLPAKEILYAELSIYPEDTPLGLNGSGLAIINPPWQIEARLHQLLPWLWQALSPQKTGGFRISKIPA